MLRSGLCNYNDAYIAVKGKITVTNPNNNGYDKKLAFKNNASFLIDNAEDLDILYKYTIYLNTVKIIEKQLGVYGTITEMNQIVVQ